MTTITNAVPGLEVPDGVERVGSKLLFENERVRVWELRLAPGQREALHEHKLDYVMIQIEATRSPASSSPTPAVLGAARLTWRAKSPTGSCSSPAAAAGNGHTTSE